jgi:pimeloyl-CoA synthetase
MEEERMLCATWVLAIFTVVLALSTIAYTIVTYKLFRETKKQADVLNSQIQAIRDLTQAVNQLPVIEQIVKDRKAAAEKIKKIQEENSPQRKATRY